MGIGTDDFIDKLLVEKYTDKFTVDNYNYIDKELPKYSKTGFVELNLSYEDIFDKKHYEEITKCYACVQEESLTKNKKLKLIADKKVKDMANPNKMYERLGVDVLSVWIGSNLLKMSDPNNQGTLLPNICMLRRYLTDSYGYIIPNVRVLDSTSLSSNEYCIFVRGKSVFKGQISESDINSNNSMQIINDLQNICVKYVHQVMTKTDVLKLMELVRSQDPTLVNDLIPTYISAIDLKRILANLILERVSIKDIILVFEILNDYARYTQNTDELSKILKKELSFV